jgi:hypothetical protein
VTSLFPDREAAEREQSRARRWMWLGCGGQLCAVWLLVGAVALAIAAQSSSDLALYVLAALLAAVGLMGGIVSSGANLYGFVRFWASRLGR